MNYLKLMSAVVVSSTILAISQAQALPIDVRAAAVGDTAVTKVQYYGPGYYRRGRGYPGEYLDRVHHAPPGTFEHLRRMRLRRLHYRYGY